MEDVGEEKKKKKKKGEKVEEKKKKRRGGGWRKKKEITLAEVLIIQKDTRKLRTRTGEGREMMSHTYLYSDKSCNNEDRHTKNNPIRSPFKTHTIPFEPFFYNNFFRSELYMYAILVSCFFQFMNMNTTKAAVKAQRGKRLKD